MKFVVIFTLLALSGGFLFFYTINSRDLINWSKFDQVLVEKEVITQTETREIVIDYYRRGLLPEYLVMESVVQLGVGIGMLFVGVIAAIHMLLDKLFFRKFYQEPRLFRAFRRSLLWGALPIGLFYLALYNLLQLSLVGIFFLILICIEFVLSTLSPREREIIAQAKSA
jgi:hypothetical protein